MKQFLLFICILFFQIELKAQVSTLNRPNDPVVLSGSQLTAFSNLTASQIVGFKFVNGSWTQIPIQVDEKELMDIMAPYGPNANSGNYVPSPSNPKITFYCDSTTYTGADSNATFDSDDELVFMAKDAGGQSNGTTPSGIISGTCQEVAITDPLGGTGYVYLFKNGGSLQQGAGVSYITYSSNVSSTSGFPSNGNGANLENTTITTSKYIWHFSAEWVSDKLQLIVGNNTDLLDRYKSFFANGNCLRHEDAFSAGENAYVCVKVGPIRAIRSYMGAVSGPLTERTHLFYESRQDIATDLRVHNIVSVFDAFDYTPAANGMTYRNNLNTTGVTIDGQPDVVTTGVLSWEQVSGTPGTISILHRTVTNLTASDGSFISYYDDNAAHPASNCTGDGQAWGTSGVGIHFNNGNVCTDPLNGCASQFLRNITTRRIIYLDAPNGSSTTASSYNNKFNNALTVAISSCQIFSGFSINTASNPSAGGNTSGNGVYTPGSSVTVVATANTGYSFSNWTENGNNVSNNASYNFSATGNKNLVANFIPNTFPGPTLYVKIFIEGYYSGSGQMNNSIIGGCLYAVGLSTNTADADYVTLSAMNENPPYNLIESQTGILKIDGSIHVTFSSAVSTGIAYYIRMTHRNALETWSAVPVILSNTTSATPYDFTNLRSKAYGNNLADLLDGSWGIFSGDISDAATIAIGVQDGIIESQDYSDLNNAVTLTLLGYIAEDITGDGIVESADDVLMENNVYYTRVVIKP